MSAMSTCGWGQKERNNARTHEKFDVMCLLPLLSMIWITCTSASVDLPRLLWQVRQWIDRRTMEKIDYIRMCNQQRAASDKVKYS